MGKRFIGAERVQEKGEGLKDGRPKRKTTEGKNLSKKVARVEYVWN